MISGWCWYLAGQTILAQHPRDMRMSYEDVTDIFHCVRIIYSMYIESRHNVQSDSNPSYCHLVQMQYEMIVLIISTGMWKSAPPWLKVEAVCFHHALHSRPWQLLHTILHRTDPIIFPLTLQTIIIAPMMSIWGKGGQCFMSFFQCSDAEGWVTRRHPPVKSCVIFIQPFISNGSLSEQLEDNLGGNWLTQAHLKNGYELVWLCLCL